MRQAGYIIDHVIAEGSLEPLGDEARCAGKFMAFDFGDAEQAAIGGGYEYFVGAVQVFGPQRFLFHRNTCCRSNVQQDAPRDAFQASRREWRRVYPSSACAEDIGSRAFGYFAALVEEQGFVEAALLCALQSPDVEDPRGHFRSGERRCCVTAIFAETQANGFAIRRKPCRTEQQVNIGQILAALPESHFIVDGIDSRCAFTHVVLLNQFAQTGTHLGGIEGKWQARVRRVFLQSLPMPLKREGFSAKNTQGGEKPAAVEQTGLAGRKARLLDGHDVPVVE